MYKLTDTFVLIKWCL